MSTHSDRGGPDRHVDEEAVGVAAAAPALQVHAAQKIPATGGGSDGGDALQSGRATSTCSRSALYYILSPWWETNM